MTREIQTDIATSRANCVALLAWLDALETKEAATQVGRVPWFVFVFNQTAELEPAAAIAANVLENAAAFSKNREQVMGGELGLTPELRESLAVAWAELEAAALGAIFRELSRAT